ncbi:EAL and HDOD domain-containing protein [Planomonospora parontospora]|uniref:EAL and HDOD domain-containing protein n=1 Tax=Planomonospora parontospora TaxID=58119 RepID=UPI00166FF230|nr:HDOD domain-containing protein [Planomonospora parontospora]GGL47090.1 histidine kinase [Planomonospora parontospora subsp. antibiotica]GII19924.1 histidine kinase [Planomonospora parontospora subsp. antibiotica]
MHLADAPVDSGWHRIHIGRQPIHDGDGALVAYELLFRSHSQAKGATARGAEATSQVIVNAFSEFGLERLAGPNLCFINLTREFLVGELPLPFDSGSVVLEVLETVRIDDEVIEGVRRLAAQGFAIALDDFVLGNDHERLLEVASYVKLEVSGIDPELLRERIAVCRAYEGLHLVAERLETEEDLEFARGLGFEFFQGYLLGRPRVLSLDTLEPSRLRHLELISKLADEDTDIDEITEIISSDPALSYRILRAANSAATGLWSEISSINDAVVILGTQRLRHWVTLMLLSDVVGVDGDVDNERMSHVLMRARLCQLLSRSLGLPSDKAFTVGLLSGIADLLGVPAEELIAHLALSHDVSFAIVEEGGPLGSVVTTARAYESGRLPEADDAHGEDLAHAYLKAVDWSMNIVTGV